MTDLCQSKQQATSLTRSSPLPTRSEMPSYYRSASEQTLIKTHLTDDDDDDSSIYKEAFILQIFQHWKIKTLEHQQSFSNPDKTSTSNHFTHALGQTPPSKETAPTGTVSNDSSVTTIEQHTVQDESIICTKQSIAAVQKRETPAPASYTRRKATLKTAHVTPTDLLNPKLLTPHAKAKSPTGSISSTRKATKPAPIFIAPKKTHPSLPPRPCALPSFDESVQSKRKLLTERQSSSTDDSNTTMWSRAPPTSPMRFNPQSTTSSVNDDDDDETSSDESRHESLLIRNKKLPKTSTKSKKQIYSSHPAHLNVPIAIFLTNPQGHLSALYLNSVSLNELIQSPAIVNNAVDYSQCTAAGLPLTPAVNLDKYTLHSIGEEEEEVAIEKEKIDGKILSKELNRIEAFTKSRNMSVGMRKPERDEQESKIPLGRRWSDGVVSDEDEKLRESPSLLDKIASTTSVLKQPIIPPVKLSRTKYLLMKLHLTSLPSASKDENHDLPSNKRTVRRSSDKKRYQTH